MVNEIIGKNKVCRKGHQYDMSRRRCPACDKATKRASMLRCRKHAREHAAKWRAEHPGYSHWSGMMNRCHNTKHPPYRNYGGRGIKVCDRWRGPGGFENFLADMGSRPTTEHSVERRDNDGNYDPSNCYWATRAEQSRNRRNNRMYTFNGKTQCIQDWTDELGLKNGVLKGRLDILGWSVEKAFSTPARRVTRKAA